MVVTGEDVSVLMDLESKKAANLMSDDLIVREVRRATSAALVPPRGHPAGQQWRLR